MRTRALDAGGEPDGRDIAALIAEAERVLGRRTRLRRLRRLARWVGDQSAVSLVVLAIIAIQVALIWGLVEVGLLIARSA